MQNPVDSTAIASIEYTQILDIKFRSGASYRYHGVPDAVYLDFVNSDSKGKFFQENIRNRYRFERMDAGGKSDE